MASSVRRQLESYLKTIDVVSFSVLDVGGLFWPVKGRTKSWTCGNYKILDIRKSRNGVKADYVYDINSIVLPEIKERFGVIFFLETMNHIYDPVQVFHNLNGLLEVNGIIYFSCHFIFPHHSGLDCLRYTRSGIQKILEVTGFKVLEVIPRYSVEPETLTRLFDKESKVQRFKGEIGYIVKACKV